MLNAANVKQHGMRDKRWTVKDKISQCKALVNLYNRDQQIMRINKLRNKQTQPKFVEYLSKQVVELRAKKDKALTGDLQAIRNALLSDRRKLLAYQHLPPKDVIDHIDKDNFDDRKELDRLIYRIKQKRNKLIQLKLAVSVLEDRLKYEISGLPIEIKIKDITAAVQDATLKKVAAISVMNIYLEIIHYMKKDRIYFDAILNTLYNDTNKKMVYLVRTIQLGQLATESLDDRRAECIQFENALKRQITMRMQEISSKRQQSASINKKAVASLYSTTCIDAAINDTTLEEDLSSAREFLTKLGDTTMCVYPEQLISCFIEQQTQYNRMVDVKDKILKGKEIIMNKLDHARLALQIVETDVGADVETFEEEEIELRRQIKKQEDRKVAIRRESKFITETSAKVELGVKSLANLLHVVMPPKKKRRSTVSSNDPSDGTYESVLSKITILLDSNAPLLNEHQADHASEFYAKLKEHVSVELGTTETASATKLVPELHFDDPFVPTRDQIKLQSKEATISGREKQQMLEDQRQLASIVK